MGNSELLRDYVEARSQPAFALLVQRYINLVYTAARRQLRGDAHLADDVTQAVFIILSQRARSIRNPAALGGWLLQTTHHVACNALRMQRRRRSHEQEAAAMKPTTIEPEQQAVHRRLAGVLDEAISRLREDDRSAIVLRFFEGKSIVDVGSAMGISEEAAQKRVTRALGRLRQLFARRGIVTAADALPEAIAGQALLSAPPALVATITAKTAALHIGSSGASALAKATARTIFWSQAKVAAVLSCAATIALAAGVVAVASNSGAPGQTATPATAPAANATSATPVAPPATPPVDDRIQRFPNIVMFNNAPADSFVAGVDPDVRRTETSEPAGYIKSTNAPPTVQGGRAFGAAIENLRGKRVRLTAWVKTRDVTNWCGLGMCVYGFGQRVLASCDMGERPIFGTTGWKQYALVADVPADAQSLVFLNQLRGSGEMWTDDFQIETVGADVPVNDDQLWHMWSPMASKCSAEMDPNTLREGHPTMRVTCNAKSWVAYDHNDRHPEQYLGKRVRASAWLKGDHVSVNSGLWIRALGPNFQKIIDEGNWGKWLSGAKPIKGTVGWTHFSCELDVPLDTQCIVSGMIHNGTGTMWMDDFKFEIVEPPPGAETK